jgi:hypothetical protein
MRACRRPLPACRCMHADGLPVPDARRFCQGPPAVRGSQQQEKNSFPPKRHRDGLPVSDDAVGLVLGVGLIAAEEAGILRQVQDVLQVLVEPHHVSVDVDAPLSPPVPGSRD